MATQQFTIEDAPPQFTIEDAPALKKTVPEPEMKVEAPAAAPDFSKSGVADAYQQRPNNPFSRYLSEAENLTEEGKKEHPVEAVVGKVSSGVKGIGGILGTMGGLLGGPEGVFGIGAEPESTPIAARVDSFVRSIPPKPEPAPVAGPITNPERMLPPGPSKPAIITPPPADASYVRGIPAEYGTPIPKPHTAANPVVAGGTDTLDTFLSKVYGVEPLKQDVRLRDQLPVAGPEPDLSITSASRNGGLAEKYPDKFVRSMVHANGGRIVDAIGDDAETMKAIHSLTRVDLRQALINAGENVGQATISNSKYAGTAAIGREQAFNTLLEKGYSPTEIVKLAKTPVEDVPVAGPPQKKSNFTVTPPAEKPPAVKVRAPREQIDNFDANTLEQAKLEVAAAREAWGAFERPGRYVVDLGEESGGGDTLRRPDKYVYGVSSARPKMEAEYPWLKNLPKMTEGKMREAVESGKGAEYNRLVNEAGRHVQATREAAAPVLSEYRERLESAARDVEKIDPGLSQTLKDLSVGKLSGVRNLSKFIRETLDDADNAAAFDKATSELSGQIEEGSGSDSGSREEDEGEGR